MLKELLEELQTQNEKRSFFQKMKSKISKMTGGDIYDVLVPKTKEISKMNFKSLEKEYAVEIWTEEEAMYWKDPVDIGLIAGAKTMYKYDSDAMFEMIRLIRDNRKDWLIEEEGGQQFFGFLSIAGTKGDLEAIVKDKFGGVSTSITKLPM
jgi:Mg2+/Co2+ transporter CorC